ncbi:uncharacterized protein LOC112573156 isoform X3 [Pomacea canaliculata]|uniref:uncharacterized protein LOC112573156 isoform X3 n=1 Tax=Pomacea canaliculata TaxID=400727 RepID=UPI000D7315EA|nr:uncharacterized protein LOC112573156 isoform X3 [Pomacea canaliculata]
MAASPRQCAPSRPRYFCVFSRGRVRRKKRPLGELETRYQYTPPQPVLSCRTVNIDVSGTRTYRPLSTADIITEQQRLIHNIFQKSRGTTSAPPTRSSRKGLGLVSNGSGRPAHHAKKDRLKNVKPATDSFMVLSVDRDLLETRRFQNQLTHQIHAHWRPENNSLNQGLFVRGQSAQEDVTPSPDAWLTFSGGQGEESEGVIDAFTSANTADNYYNVHGSVGSRIAMQLQKGDRIRIGVNGHILSHDLKVKKWTKDEGEDDQDKGNEKLGDDGEKEQEEQDEKEDPHNPALTNGEDQTTLADFDFGELVFYPLDKNVQEGREKKQKPAIPEIPLSWGDQIGRPEVKVLSPRVTPRDNDREKLLTIDCPRPRLASATSSGGYRVKQRPLGHTRHDNRFDANNNKVKAITVDRLSPEDELHLSSLSVDDVIQHRLDKSPSNLGANSGESNTKAPARKGEVSLSSSARRSKNKQDSAGRTGHARSARQTTEVAGHVGGDVASSRSHLPGRSVSPSHAHVTWNSDTLNFSLSHSHGSEVRHKTGSAKVQSKSFTIGRTAPLHRAGLGLGGSVSSINIGSLPGETEYIQIAQPIRNPNSSATNGVRSLYSQFAMYGGDATVPRAPAARRNLSQDRLADSSTMGLPSPRVLPPQTGQELMEPPHPPSPEANETPSERMGANLLTPFSDLYPPPSSAMAISIPTADNLSDRESPTPLSMDGRTPGKDERGLSFAERRERSVRNQHIDHIADLLAGALLDQEQA